MTERPPCRLDIFFATEASRAVILRRGPTKHVRMIAWNTRKDTFEDGQWVKHRVYEHKCALSPDGVHFAYFGFCEGGGLGGMTGGFSAISEVPYFTALALLVEGSTWGTGARFIDRNHVLCPYPYTNMIPPLPAPLRWVWHPSDHSGNRDPGPTARDQAPKHVLLASGAPASVKPAAMERFRAEWSSTEQAPTMPDWCVVEDGCLYRVKAKKKRVLLRDFNSMEFEPIQAPYEGVRT